MRFHRFEPKAFAIALAVHVVALVLWRWVLPHSPDFIQVGIGLPLAIQLWFPLPAWLAPWPLLLIYGAGFAAVGYPIFAAAPPGRLRTWLCGIFYYLLLLMAWPLFTGVVCPTCIQ